MDADGGDSSSAPSMRHAAADPAGSPPGGREVYAFWVNQDVVVPPAAFLGAVRGAAASPLNRRLLAG